MIRITKICWIIGLFMMVSLAQAAGQLSDFNGKTSSINDFTGKGKWTIVMIWASDCHVCNSEVHNYNDFHDWHKDKDATVLGITLDGQKKKPEAEKFIERHAVSFTSLIGEVEDVASIYTDLTGGPFAGTPTFLVFGPDGTLKAQQVGAVPTDLIEKFIAKHSSKFSNVSTTEKSSEK